jgi:predicted transcriptional regulator of viral defense system
LLSPAISFAISAINFATAAPLSLPWLVAGAVRLGAFRKVDAAATAFVNEDCGLPAYVLLYMYSSTMSQEPLTKTGRVAVNSRNEKRYLSELVEVLKKPRRHNELKEAIKRFGLSHNLTDSGLRRIEAKLSGERGLKEINLKWKAGAPLPVPRLFSTASAADIHPLEVASALHRKSYLCYHTALFWNQLTEQVPTTYYIAIERPYTSSLGAQPAKEPLDDFVLRDVFVRTHNEHKNVATLRDARFVTIARAYSGAAGVVHRTVQVGERNIEIAITGLERTLIDCIAVPEDAGGISNVIDALKAGASSIDFDVLVALYDELEFKYPHWQRIGLLLQKLGLEEQAKRWASKFGQPKNKFFIAKGYRLEWEFDNEWSIYYPRGLFG